MKISLSDRYLSLVPFEVEIPQFTLVTGLNGSGKSQLLSGIQLGHIKCDIFPPATHLDHTSIHRFTPGDFVADLSSSQYEQFSNVATRDDTARVLERGTKQCRAKWLAWGEERGLNLVGLKDLTSQAYIQQKTPRRGFVPDKQFLELNALLNSLRTEAPPIHSLDRSAGLIGGRGDLSNIQDRLNLPYFLLDGQEFWEGMLDPTQFFHSSLVTTFSRYRDLQLINRLRRLQREDGEDAEEPLTGSEFTTRYGPPPWELLNETLSKLGLTARFASPKASEQTAYTPRLFTPSGDTFSPHDLSSGEKVILNLALCGYQTDNKAERIVAPKLLLLDEVDAPLHPAMAQTYLRVIEDVLVGTFKMHVIATTHSPSTVALFPSDTIYVMQASISGPQPQQKSNALSSLLHGVPTLAVSLRDRRQIFAESPVEADNLDKLYQIVRHSLPSPISLQFIPTGSKHDNSSRDNVQRIVGSLSKTGNDTVLGLIDWDLKNQPTDRVRVLAHCRRYALENIVLDPLIVAFAIYRFQPKLVGHYGLDSSISFRELAKLNPEVCQTVADKVVSSVFKRPLTEGRLEYKYRCGLILSIESEYMLENGHDLESKIAEAFPIFDGRVRGGSGKLTEYIIEHVLVDYPEIIPCEVLEAFNSLLEPL